MLATICAFACICSDVCAFIVVMLFVPKTVPKCVNMMLYDLSLVVNVYSVMFSFQDCKEIRPCCQSEDRSLATGELEVTRPISFTASSPQLNNV